MAPLYQIKDWDKHFENDRSRTRDRCSFACVPNKQDGHGFTKIMAERDGASIYGVWILLVGLCSRQKRPRRGFVTEDGSEKGRPLTISDLALRWRRSVREVQRSIDFLVSPVGWVAASGGVEESPPANRALPADSPRGPLEEKGIEEKRTSPPVSPPPGGTARGEKRPRDLAEVREHWSTNGLRGNPESFFEYHDDRGWKWASWKRAAGNWSRREPPERYLAAAPIERKPEEPTRPTLSLEEKRDAWIRICREHHGKPERDRTKLLADWIHAQEGELVQRSLELARKESA